MPETPQTSIVELRCAGTRTRGRMRWRDESGQSFVEFALVCPLLFLLVLGIFKFGMAFNTYLTLNDAVRNGARQLSVERGQINACTIATNVVTNQANIPAANVNVTFQSADGITPPASSCVNPNDPDALHSGEGAQIKATTSCDLQIMGINFVPGCTLTASSTERIE